MKSNIGIIDRSFANKTTGRYTKYLGNLLYLKRGIVSSWNRIDFVYAFPFRIVKRIVTILKKFVFAKTIQQIENLINLQLDIRFKAYQSIFPFLVTRYLQRYSSLTRSFLDRFWVKSFSSHKIELQRKEDGFGNTLWDTNYQRLKSFERQYYYRQDFLEKNNFIEMKTNANVDKRARLYIHTPFFKTKGERPKQEHIIRELPLIVRETTERVVEKEASSQPQIQTAKIDVKHLSEQILRSFDYEQFLRSLERRIRIERERRGL